MSRSQDRRSRADKLRDLAARGATEAERAAAQKALDAMPAEQVPQQPLRTGDFRRNFSVYGGPVPPRHHNSRSYSHTSSHASRESAATDVHERVVRMQRALTELMRSVMAAQGAMENFDATLRETARMYGLSEEELRQVLTALTDPAGDENDLDGSEEFFNEGDEDDDGDQWAWDAG